MIKNRLLKATMASILALTVLFDTPMNSYAAWEQTGQGWRYTSENGYVAGSFISDEGKQYYIKDSGIMAASEWIQVDNDWYYAGADGALYTGEQVIGNDAYTFNANGLMTLDGVHRDGLEDDILEKAFVWTAQHMDESRYALDLVNNIRAEVNRPPLQFDYTLCLASTYKCFHQVKYDYIGHNYNNTKPAIIALNAIQGRTTLAKRTIDNVSYRGAMRFRYFNGFYEYYDETTAGLKGSPSHYEGMIDPGIKYGGVGFAYTQREDGEYNYYYTAMFTE